MLSLNQWLKNYMLMIMIRIYNPERSLACRFNDALSAREPMDLQHKPPTILIFILCLFTFHFSLFTNKRKQIAQLFSTFNLVVYFIFGRDYKWGRIYLIIQVGFLAFNLS